jgi:hypothetical protein
MTNVTTKKFWQSTNFYIHAILAVVALWGWVQPELITELVIGGFAVAAGFGFIRNHIKTGKFDKSKFFDANWWAYVGTAISSVTAISIPPETYDAIANLLQAFGDKNWPAVITALITIGSMVYNIFVKPAIGPSK